MKRSASGLGALLLAAAVACAPLPASDELADAHSAPSGRTFEPPPDPVTLRAERPGRQLRHATLRVRATSCTSMTFGTAFALDSNTLVTNQHVISGASRVEVTTWDGQTYRAEVAAAGTIYDLGIVELENDLPATLPVGPRPTRGDDVRVVGYPSGGPIDLQDARVFNYVDGERYNEPGDIMRLSADVIPGNSGGPVINDATEVVAVVFARETPSGFALALPIDQLTNQLELDAFQPITPHC